VALSGSGDASVAATAAGASALEDDFGDSTSPSTAPGDSSSVFVATESWGGASGV
jgi:hypothetical protein